MSIVYFWKHSCWTDNYSISLFISFILACKFNSWRLLYSSCSLSSESIRSSIILAALYTTYSIASFISNWNFLIKIVLSHVVVLPKVSRICGLSSGRNSPLFDPYIGMRWLLLIQVLLTFQNLSDRDILQWISVGANKNEWRKLSNILECFYN